MADIKQNCPTGSTSFKEAVCIDGGRVYDSCCDRDCLTDLRCYFSPEDQRLINSAVSVRIKSAEVIDVNIDVEPVTFNRGFYSCDLTFFFLVDVEVFTAPHTCPCTVHGICFYNKKAILYGSEGNVKTFTNEYVSDDDCGRRTLSGGNSPKCVVQSVDPIALSAKLGCVRTCENMPGFVPAKVCSAIGGSIETGIESGGSAVYVTLGLFTIIQLIRNVQMLIPVYDFCIPEKQCDDSTDTPCDVFRKIKFPTDDFFPPRPCDADTDCGCGSDCGCEEE
ncbi:MAG: hypothetical protein J6Q67_02510 [Clostridia bacterium]|nr:hypothetical protein [Clostridia bacterium]